MGKAGRDRIMALPEEEEEAEAEGAHQGDDCFCC